MKSSLLTSICGLLIGATIIVSCDKYVDKKPDDITFDRPYCNDPLAANYNTNFPGYVDNSTCEYAVDYLSGVWNFIDTMYAEGDTSILATQQYTLQLSNPSSDTTKSKVLVNGICTNPLYFTVNKYGYAYSDTLIEESDGEQLFCSINDTLSGSIIRQIHYDADSTMITSLKIDWAVRNNGVTTLHQGIATK